MQALHEINRTYELGIPFLAATALATAVSLVKAQAFSGVFGKETEIDETADMYVLLGRNAGGWLDDLDMKAREAGKPIVALFANRPEAVDVMRSPSFICATEAEVLGLRLKCLNGFSASEIAEYAERLFSRRNYFDDFDAVLIPALPEPERSAVISAAATERTNLVLYGSPERRSLKWTKGIQTRGIMLSETVFFERRTE